MHYFKTLALTLCVSLTAAPAMAQTDDSDSTAADSHSKNGGSSLSISPGDGTPDHTPVGHWYSSNSLDGAILSSAVFERPGERRKLTVPRFSMINFGYHFNYDFDTHFGIFTGLGIKNIGFIEKDSRPYNSDDSTIKRRVYTIGVPLGFKLGNLQKKNYGFIGGGVDFPFNFREKGFVKRNDKAKFSEWFSDRTADYMPYLFAGFSARGTTLKLQYYPGNFFNPEYNETNAAGLTVYPYRCYNANLLYVTLGVDVHYTKKKKHKADNDSDGDETPRHPASPTGM